MLRQHLALLTAGLCILSCTANQMHRHTGLEEHADYSLSFIELDDHPFWVATQAHPEFKSRPDRAHPLFRGNGAHRRHIGFAVQDQDGGIVRILGEDAHELMTPALRALFSGRTGRQPLYHIAIEELQEWAYTGEPLVPLKGYPGVVWQRSKKKKRIAGDDPFSLGRAGQP